MRRSVVALLVSAVFFCLLSGCRKAGTSASKEDTPEAAFARIQKAAAEGDIAAYYDLCDEKGQAGLCELAWQLITIEIYARDPSRSREVAGIKRAFQEELDISPEQAEASESDPKVRRKVLLQILEKSHGLVPDSLKEALGRIAKHELLSCEIERPGVARLQLKSDAGEKSWYMLQEDGRWVIAGGMSPYRPD